MNWWQTLLLVCTALPTIRAIYEDQISKFDWHKSYIGRLNDGPATYFAPFSNDLLLTTTAENVVAALSAKTGALLWRQVLERGPRGHIHFAALFTDTAYSSPQHTFLTVVGGGTGNPHLIRGWDPIHGYLLWEWSMTLAATTPAPAMAGEFWFYENLVLYHVLAYWGSHLEVTQYFATTGQPLKAGTSRITTPWIVKDECVLAEPFFVCGIKNQILGVNLISENGALFSQPLMEDIKGKIVPMPGLGGTIILNGQLFSLTGQTYATKLNANAKYLVQTIDEQPILFQLSKSDTAQTTFQLSATNLKTNQDVYQPLNVSPKDATLVLGDVAAIRAVKCRSKQSEMMCQVLMETTDETVVMLQQAKILWHREEALANVAAMEMVELPLSYLEGSIEDEFNSKDGNALEGFIRRISSQVQQVKSLFMTVMGMMDNSNNNDDRHADAMQRNLLVRDAFGLHKMIVIVTRSGNLYGIDNMSGKVHWKKHLPELAMFEGGAGGEQQQEKIKMIALRTARHFPYPIKYALIGRTKAGGHVGSGFILEFDPITGREEGRHQLDYKIKQLTVLPETEQTQYLRPLLILDESNRAHVLPRQFASEATGIYMYTVAVDGVLNGYYIGKGLQVLSIWELNVGGPPSSGQRVLSVASKNPMEHVHSQGRVLSDRSVLYKYINPNLIAVATIGPHSIHKTVLNVYLIDVVSGTVIFSMNHKRVKEPFHMVHSENWLAYSYFNEKVRRTEITTMELYEGKTQTNSTVWSSLDPPPLPLVERQSYIVPMAVVALKETITEKGITNKDVLFGLTNGGILEMPWALLDPRRPIQEPNQPREEGVIPYIPELPLPTENIINYNQSVARIQGIYTAPSGLESTCLVVVYGLDMFVTRVSPSKTFDLLKDDFDYYIITAVLLGLTTASYVVKQLSSRKAQKQAWK